MRDRRPLDRRRADELADTLTTPMGQSLAEHAHVACMRIRQLAAFAQDVRSERHQRLALAHSSRAPIARAAVLRLAEWIADEELGALALGRVDDDPRWTWLLGRGLVAVVDGHLVRTVLGREVLRVARELRIGKEAA